MNVLWMRNNPKSKNITGDRTLKSNSNINFIENLSVCCAVFVFQRKPPQWAWSSWRGRQRTQHQWWRWVTQKHGPGLKVVTPWNVQKSHAGLRLIRVCVLCVLRTGANWGHSQVWLRGPKSQRAVLQEGSLPVTVPASVWGLVGGPAQRCRWADSTSVHCGAGHVRGIYFNCETHHWIRFLVSVKSHFFSTQQTNGESQLQDSSYFWLSHYLCCSIFSKCLLSYLSPKLCVLLNVWLFKVLCKDEGIKSFFHFSPSSFKYFLSLFFGFLFFEGRLGSQHVVVQ